jgi:GNAT superfamily N-acetyltransferase
VDSLSPVNILLDAKTQHIFVALEAGKVIGTGSLVNHGSTEMPAYYGTAIFVLPEYQRTGVGSQLMRKVEAQAVKLGADKITVRAAVNAQEFYKKIGYDYQDGIETPDEKGNFVMGKALQK